ncbi:unnamed protein product [Candidula unifasciata]|uniref:Hexosyltransferase n=1 Tax=Candidula unifasciata TaxID=100452 RepID=A0A8S3ZR34_9EUPU|nr:unnamed protein product [Candidula unifasciata]
MLQRERHLVAHKSVRLTSFRNLTLCLFGIAAGIFLVNILRITISRRRISCGSHRHGHPTEFGKTTLGGSHDLLASSEERFLFVGVMTTRKFLATRALASRLTWVSRVPGQVVYFLEKGEAYQGDLNVVELDGIEENAYPPQKKSFAMLQYINHHYAEDYEVISYVSLLIKKTYLTE